MSKLEEISDPDPKLFSRSSSNEVTITDQASSDLNHVSEELSNHLRNVGLDESVKDLSVHISLAESNERMIMYPMRPDAEDCSFYMRTGSCKYGSSCKFNHPLRWKLQIGREKIREREENAENSKLMECKHYFRTGGCKYGESCRFSHTKEQTFMASRPQQLNFLGLPIRPGEKECPFYIRHGSCKFGSDCKFNHPNPTATEGVDSSLFHGNNGGHVGSFSPQATSQASSTSWSSSRHMNGTGTSPFIPVMFSQNRGVSPPQTSYPMNNSSTETSSVSMPVEEFPERPDQPECSYYLKTGDCKYKSKCKYNHPKILLPKQAPFSLNDKGLPLRPDQNLCTHYSRYGICKFGPACRFDHSILPNFSTNSSQTLEAPQVTGNGNEAN